LEIESKSLSDYRHNKGNTLEKKMIGDALWSKTNCNAGEMMNPPALYQGKKTVL
jgi:hypothetical protein